MALSPSAVLKPALSFQRVVKFFLASPRRSSLKAIWYEENHAFVRTTSRDHRDDDSTSLRRHGRHPVREANAGSLRRNPCDDAGQGHYSDGDRRGLFALHARRFETDWRTVG